MSDHITLSSWMQLCLLCATQINTTHISINIAVYSEENMYLLVTLWCCFRVQAFTICENSHLWALFFYSTHLSQAYTKLTVYTTGSQSPGHQYFNKFCKDKSFSLFCSTTAVTVRFCYVAFHFEILFGFLLFLFTRSFWFRFP